MLDSLSNSLLADVLLDLLNLLSSNILDSTLNGLLGSRSGTKSIHNFFHILGLLELLRQLGKRCLNDLRGSVLQGFHSVVAASQGQRLGGLRSWGVKKFVEGLPSFFNLVARFVIKDVLKVLRGLRNFIVVGK